MWKMFLGTDEQGKNISLFIKASCPAIYPSKATPGSPTLFASNDPQSRELLLRSRSRKLTVSDPVTVCWAIRLWVARESVCKCPPETKSHSYKVPPLRGLCPLRSCGPWHKWTQT